MRVKYESVAETEERDPIMVEGETSTGYYCQLMADPKDVAKILLECNYPVWRVLDEDAPRAMWEYLGRKFGLEYVCSVGLRKLVKSAANTRVR